ncbi:MAG: hypothetical protein J0I48_06775 [Devosia sp.]|mgnify:CR=1 FL=1|uniref:hypothetical protein n=1 Tax=Devosia sp. 66-22 TaxID=1895753 RepID=UPI0009263AE4|nr:hypothetical protein [Devosia sp. 66-22]MBN9345896.1 hypothetical protein [Devosia sp.]OJX49714.1 MAG: hypothetical protein BGO81_19290 [Devosia sp. 66-22]
MKKPPNGGREGVAFGLEGSAARPISEVVEEMDALLGGSPIAEPDLAPKALDTDAIWKAHNSRAPFKGIR